MTRVCLSWSAHVQGPTNSYQSVVFKLFSVILGDWQFDYLNTLIQTEGYW